MLGSQVESDLELDALPSAVPTILPWGSKVFRAQLTDPSADPRVLKRRQLPFVALQKHKELRESVRETLKDLSGATAEIDTCFARIDPLAGESIKQIFYEKGSRAEFLNTSDTYLNSVFFWKTVFLPGFAVLAPLVGLLLPFFMFKAVGSPMSVPDYLTHIRGAILKQMNIPTFFKARGEGDRLGGFFEMLFIGFALIMFISGIWNQVTAALHLRAIWARLCDQGGAVSRLLEKAEHLLTMFREARAPVRRALDALIVNGTQALEKCAPLRGNTPISITGTLWNSDELLTPLRNWFGQLDVYTALASLPICRVHYVSKPGINVKDLVHPSLPSCVSNNYESPGHGILTGPNRGGKSTFCKALGLAVLTAQSWGVAWAGSMTLMPFGAIHTALEPAGKLGHASTFEAEIVFAKSVLEASARPLFVMMDEIFHSTNAVDGIRASGVYLDALYAKQGVCSLISTHYRALAEQFTGRATVYQMVAHGGTPLTYTYKIAEGVSDKSSVDELLMSHGLLAQTDNAVEVPTKL
jgi:hypothetical protein